MKRTGIKLMALLLMFALLLGLTACGAAPAEPRPVPEAANPADETVLAEADRPELPEQPDEAAMWEAVDALWGRDDLTEEERSAESQRLQEDYSTQESTYREALSALRGEPVENGAGFRAFTNAVSARLLSGTEKNRVVSPANLYLALAMLAEITAGETQGQILDLLGAEDAESLRALCRRVWENLYLDGENSKTLPANSIWLRDGLNVRPEPLEVLASDYYADAWQVPMGTAEADEALRDWLNENTNHLLEDSVGSLKTAPETLLMLASTLYFKGAWLDEFYEAATAPDEFTLPDGSAVTTDFMHTTREQTAANLVGYTIAALPFAEQGSMVFLLPDEGVTLDEALARGGLEDALLLQEMNLPVYDVQWSVPKFDVGSTLDLVEDLQALGVTDAFDAVLADFTPLIADEAELSPYVSQVQHAARVLVDEEGCEAAAYTIIAVAEGACMPESRPTLVMNLNRPFLFLITGLDGLPLFVGVVQTP